MSTPWILRRARPVPPRVRMFCFPCAGGGASMFREWGAGLPADVDVCRVQLPGRENRLHETPCRSVSELMPDLVRELAPHLDTPFVLFGHSLGALVSFELARHLRRMGAAGPVRLIVAAHPAPHRREQRQPLHEAPDADILAELARLEGTPNSALQNAELMSTMLPLLRADFAMVETYRYLPQAPLTCPISVFGGTNDDFISTERLEAWREHTVNSCTLRMLPGGHFFVRSAGAELLQAIASDLRHVAGEPAHVR